MATFVGRYISKCEFILNDGGESGVSIDITAKFINVKTQIT